MNRGRLRFKLSPLPWRSNLRQVYEVHHIQFCLCVSIRHQPQGPCFLLGVHQCDRQREWQPHERAFLDFESSWPFS
ncbi:MAG: GAF domain-containing protein [Thermosynechococcus sp.]|uniref:GAF domain-containing protein n=1 Tax=Thermosynechococcus sp. TaxID=2814275 RepID=UPI003919680E